MKRLRIAGAAAVVAAIAAGTTYATTALTSGAAATNTIQACVKKENGDVRIVDSSTQCHRDERSVNWNVVGPQGPQGQKGDAGAKGDNGLSVQASALAPGDTNCPDGGSMFTVGTAAPTYACNGAAGKNGKDGADGTSFTSIDGLGGLTCTSGGTAGTIAVAVGPGGVVTLTCSTGGGSTGGGGGGGGGGTDCGALPAYPNGTVTCSNGTLVYSCNVGFADADGNLANGCEANLMTDVNNCGGPGVVASLPHANTGCVDGHPVILSCQPGWVNLNGDATDGCEAAASCPHPNGLGGSYDDCADPLGTPGDPTTYSLTMAMLAGAGGTPTPVLCNGAGAVVAQVGSHFATWQYGGPNAGHVVESLSGTACPTSADPVWR